MLARALAILATALGPLVSTVDAREPELAVGQVWSVKDGGSMLATIGRLEDWGGKPIVHISITGIPLPTEVAGPGKTTTVAHAPFFADAFVVSIDSLVASNGSPSENFEAGYAQWKSAGGGVFTITVADAAKLAIGQAVKAAPIAPH